MRVIDRALRLVDDGWQLVEDGAALPSGDVIVSVARWQQEREALRARGSRLGLCLSGATPVSAVVGDLDQFALIALDFPKFADGRCYSHARLLRERYGYQGELRAVGEVLRDQLEFMRRCGIDSFALCAGRNPDDALKAFDDFSLHYQTAADDVVPVQRQR
jgi:uncharacterized protein (DUF934 family)